MSKNKTNHSAPIRNLTGFMKAYLKSESGIRAIHRAPKFIDRTVHDAKGKLLQFKEFKGSNSIALAFKEAFNA